MSIVEQQKSTLRRMQPKPGQTNRIITIKETAITHSIATTWNKRTTIFSTVALACLISLGTTHTALADGERSEQTPRFWQQDPEAAFPNKGLNHCAPTSVSNGLIYLATERGFEDLADDTYHEGQIALIKDLAEEMATDPTEGTNPDKILTGLQSFVQKRGYSFEKLELATWRGVGAKNKKFLIGTKPGLKWMTAAAKDPDTVVIFNFGWYRESTDGQYTRHSGHWVHVVGAGPGALRFDVHNPALKPEIQKTNTAITLKRVGEEFVMKDARGKKTEMDGYYQATGPGLPFNKKSVSSAVLDAVIVFKLNEE